MKETITFEDITKIAVIITFIYGLFGVGMWSANQIDNCFDEIGMDVCAEENVEFRNVEDKAVNCVDEDRKLTTYYYKNIEIEECSKTSFFPFK